MPSWKKVDITPDRFAGWLIGAPMAWGLVGLYAIHLAFWLPQRLVLPMWADHDVFATMARGWSLGMLPYRDLLGNNFPGTVYLFWVLGRLFGWGKAAPFYALDAAFLVGFVALLAAWSVRRFGRALPGLVSGGAFLAVFLAFDYTEAAQRDGQGSIFAVAGLLIAQAWPGRVGRIASALMLAIGTTIRPQVLILVPAFWMAIDEAARPPGGRRLAAFRALAEWQLALALFIAAGLLPLAMAGILGDFFEGLKLVAYGSSYNAAGFSTIGPRLVVQFYWIWGALVFPVAVVFARGSIRDRDRRLVATWALALLLIAFYAPLSPVPRVYSYQAIKIVLAIFVAILAHLVLSAPQLSPGWKFSLLILILGGVTSLRPIYVSVTRARESIASLRYGSIPTKTPLGYSHPYDPDIIRLYPLADYWAMVDHVRSSTRPTTRVAGVLFGVAVTGPVNRLPAFPAESITWLTAVNTDDEHRFADALGRATDSVVVWNPGDPNALRDYPEVLAAIRRLYEPGSRFGQIEVWNRKLGTGPAP